MGQLIWISGASSGIGRALVDTIPWPEARIINISRRPVAGIENLELDLVNPTSWEVVARSFEREVASFDGELAVFVHSAGTLSPIGFAGEVPADSYTRAVLLGSAAPQVLGSAFLAALRKVRGRGVRGLIVMLTSGAATNPYEGWTAYGAGKAAIDQWVRTAGREQKSRGDHCRVLAVAPGLVETAMQEEIRATATTDFPDVDDFREYHRSGVIRSPEVAAREIWRLVRDRDLENGAVEDLRR